MLILSNSLTANADEGSLKLATSLVKRIQRVCTDAKIISFEREYPQSDMHITLNKFHISKQLISLIKKERETVLYIPFPAPTLSMALRVKILSLFAGRKLKVMMIRQFQMGRLARFLLKRSKAQLVVFSKKANDFYGKMIGTHRVDYIKTGVDTTQFVPVGDAEKKQLKVKHGFDPQKPLVLHVGHMKEGRNVGQLLKISDQYQVLLVISTLSKERQSEELRQRLEQGNVRVMDEYIPAIQEIYQMADVYFFPVLQEGHCIDVPLSCLEAAACNLPVVTTDYGEMSELINREGFYFLESLDAAYIDRCLQNALHCGVDTRKTAKEYDWNNAIEQMLKRRK